jgi:hypothetical protein
MAITQEIHKRTTVRRTAEDPIVEEQIVEPVTEGRYVSERRSSYAILFYILDVVEGLLALRLLFKLLAANPANGFVNFLYTITAPLVAPFAGIFRSTGVSSAGSILEVGTIIAMIIYALLVYAIVGLLRAADNRRTVYHS